MAEPIEAEDRAAEKEGRAERTSSNVLRIFGELSGDQLTEAKALKLFDSVLAAYLKKQRFAKTIDTIPGYKLAGALKRKLV